MGRNRRADQLDPALPRRGPDHAVVRLPGAVPGVVLGVSRFTGIVAAIVYAAPVAIKIMADGIRGVSADTVEAAQSVGLEHLAGHQQGAVADGSARSLALATNQGLIYVLSMVVVGGLVGGGALGYGGRRLLADQSVRQGTGGRTRDRAARHDSRPHDSGRGTTDRTERVNEMQGVRGADSPRW